MEEKKEKKLEELIGLAIESMAVAVTIIDPNGIMLYYNRHAARILDRKPEYIGKDAHSHHKKAASNRRFDRMLQEFRNGRTEPFHYEARPYGKTILVTLSPVLANGKLSGCTQSVQLKEEIEWICGNQMQGCQSAQ